MPFTREGARRSGVEKWVLARRRSKKVSYFSK